MLCDIHANIHQDPRGFGHLAIVVDDINEACDRFEKMGVHFQKKLHEGSMKNIGTRLPSFTNMFAMMLTRRKFGNPQYQLLF